MLRFLSAFLAVVLTASTASAWGDNIGVADASLRLAGLVDGNAGGVSRSYATCGSMTFQGTSLDTGSYQIYELTSAENAAVTSLSYVTTNGTLLGSFDSSDNDTITTFAPSDDFIRVVEVTEDRGRRAAVNLTCDFGAGSGSGGSSGPPASGVDTTLTLFENADFGDATTADRVTTRIDATTDLLVSPTHWMGPLGLSGSRILSTFIDEPSGGHAQVREWVKWFMASNDTDVGSVHLLSDNTSPYNNAITVGAIAGGRAVGQALSLRMGLNNDGGNDYCEVSVLRSVSPSSFLTLTPSSLAIDADWIQCGGVIQVGPAAANTGGVGAIELGAEGESYHVPLTDCECTASDCVLLVQVADRPAGIGETCDDIQDWHMNLFVGEVYP